MVDPEGNILSIILPNKKSCSNITKWRKEKFTRSLKKFSVTKTLQAFIEKYLRLKTRSWFLWKKINIFRQIIDFTKKVSIELISRKNFERDCVTHVHTVYVEIAENSYRKNMSSNHLSSNFLVKLLLSRNFCQKSVRVNLRNFHTVQKCHTIFK